MQLLKFQNLKFVEFQISKFELYINENEKEEKNKKEHKFIEKNNNSFKKWVINL